MPTYAYACRDCHHRFEAVQSMNEASLSTCPLCEGSLRRVFESVGVTFRGEGFYRTDSRPKKKAKPATSGGGDHA